MTRSALARRCRSAAPLVAFIATAVLAIALAAQAQLVCSHAMRVALPAAMPGMDMPMPDAGTPAAIIALCPVVLILGIAAALLAANALVLLLSDPHRALTTRALARLPFAATAGAVIACGAIAVALMMTIDHSAPAGISGWLVLGAIVLAIAVATTVIAIGTARCAVALTRRIAIAIGIAIALLTPAARVPAYQRSARRTRIARRSPVLAARRGLRAPPTTRR